MRAVIGLSLPALVNALRMGARGHDWDRIAAVELLISHGSWLHRADFRSELIELDSTRRSAWLDLKAAAEWVDSCRASSSERSILRLACHLVGAVNIGPEDGDARRWTVQSILQPLGQVNRQSALEAFRYAVEGPPRTAETGANS